MALLQIVDISLLASPRHCEKNSEKDSKKDSKKDSGTDSKKDKTASIDKKNWLEIPDATLLCEDNVIVFVGSQQDYITWLNDHPDNAKYQHPEQVLSAKGCVVMPGMVNCHHHMYQTLTRTIGTAQGHKLFDWLKLLYPVWAELDSTAVYTSAKVALAELVMTGCTTAADHLYLYPNDSRIDDEIAAAHELGVRFHPTRGSMSLGESKGGLPPDRVCENEEDILKDCVRVIEQFHDSSAYSMLQIGVAPCSPFSVTENLMRESATLARHYGVNMHTHMAETKDENQFCIDMFGKRPIDYAESVGWMGDDVWFAHMVHPNESEIKRMGDCRTGICHCPSSNMILASGIAPVRQMIDNNVRVGLGVDGSASNDGNHMLAEARQTMLLQRVMAEADTMSAREALSLATLGGAEVLGRNDIGRLEVGMAADIIAFRIDDLAHAGGQLDLLASLLTCAPQQVHHSIINGKVVVENGELLGVDLDALTQEHNDISYRMLNRAGHIR